MWWVGVACASWWVDATDAWLGQTQGWTHKVTVADLDGDGQLDILFPNGGNYSTPGNPEDVAIFRWNSQEFEPFIWPGATGWFRAAKVGDLNGDGIADLLLAGAFESESRLFLGDGLGGLQDASDRLPTTTDSFGDLELGDVDGDGDLDAVGADWGAGDPLQNDGGPTKLWLNSGDAHFIEASIAQLPEVMRGMSWDLELVDTDNDFDLDILVSCKLCSGGLLFENDGYGYFTDMTEGHLPQRSNNYDYEPMDIDADGDLDLATINDGGGLKETILRNDHGVFTDISETALPTGTNIGLDDNVAVFVDIDGDADADLVIGSLSDPDRVLRNDGSGSFELVSSIFDLDTPGTLGLAIADIDGDARWDAVMAQGELAFSEKVFLGTEPIAIDDQPPIIGDGAQGESRYRIRIHDQKTPFSPFDFLAVTAQWTKNGESHIVSLSWAGEALWQTDSELPQDARICATDRAGNTACNLSLVAVELPSEPRCRCGSDPMTASWIGWLVFGLLFRRKNLSHPIVR